MDEMFAAETFARSGKFEVKVFSLKPLEGYFRSERPEALLSLRGPDERQLLDDAVRYMRAAMKEKGTER